MNAGKYIKTSDGTTEPISFFEAQEHLRLDDEITDENTVNLYIKAARESFEYHTDFVVTTSQTWEVYFKKWYDLFYIRKAPILGISSVEYYDTDDAIQTYAASNYRTHLLGKENYIEIKSSSTKPTLSNREFPIKVTFTAGYATASAVPAIAKQAIFYLLGHFYANRQQVVVMPGATAVDMPQGFYSLVSRMKIWK